ncbi:hypothetical protein OH76DRAFT_1422789 [Lentinus brumalis]|uniref:Fungal-type protein kinase domain-containing protein n=1 Tax=Lentinus brumalis TaxID=2498619 RepID=A0A371CNY1_9APHY|nr:hypothetical protein OH76DRAFT_1422789 [Polyporus brumalis]
MEPSHTDPPPQAQRSRPGPLTASSVQTPPPQGSSGPASPPRSPTTPPSTSQGQPLSQAPPSEDRQNARARTSDWNHPSDGVYKNTPVKGKPSSTSRHGLFQRGDDPHKKRRIALAKEMRWVQCHVEDWFECCMPGTAAPPEGMAFAAMNVPEKGAESGMYPGIHNGCVEYLKTVGSTEFTVRCTDSLKDKASSKVDSASDLSDYNADRPDLVVFPTHSDALEAYRWKEDAKKPKPKDSEASVAGGSTQGPTPSTHGERVSDGLGAAQSNLADIFQDVSQDGNPGPDASEVQNAPVFRGQMSWAWAEVLIEVKRSRDNFPFLHTTNGRTAAFLPDGENHVLSRGQIADYAVEVFKYQHRHFVFTILILDDHARLVCFDRKDAMVSDAFDYRKHPEILGQFFHRGFNHAARREQRGHDPTACVASKAEQEIFVNAHKAFEDAPVVEKALTRAVSASYPVYKINMTGMWSADGSPLTTESPGTLSTHVCLVGRPEFCSASLVGRGTKGFVALDIGLAPDDGAADDGLAPDVSSASEVEVEAPKAIFIKDTWRPDSSDIVPEGEHYKVLWSKALSEESDGTDPEERKVYIPTSICMGDVVSPAAQLSAGTVTDPGVGAPSGTSRAAEAPRVQRTLTRPPTTRPHGDLPRIHHRLAIKEICSTLEDFTNPYELILGVYFALLAHQFAWEKCGILHRDISVGNILLCYLNGQTTGARFGLLADWDLAKTKEQLHKQQATQPSRSGTWQFMSALLQKYANKPHELADDLESFLHVLNWCAWKYFLHAASDDRTMLAEMFFMMFDRVVRDPPQLAQFKLKTLGLERGYADKLRCVKNGHAVVEGLPEGHPFTTLLAKLTAIIKQHYDTIDFAVLGNPITPQQTSPLATSDVELFPGKVPAPTRGKVGSQSVARAKETAAPRTGESTTHSQGNATAATEISNSSSNVSASRSVAVSPLQDHIAIMDVFYALLDRSIWAGGNKLPPLAKTKDQVPYFTAPPNSLYPRTSSKRIRDLASEAESSSSFVPGNVFSPSSASGELTWEYPYTLEDPHSKEKENAGRQIQPRDAKRQRLLTES